MKYENTQGSRELQALVDAVKPIMEQVSDEAGRGMPSPEPHEILLEDSDIKKLRMALADAKRILNNHWEVLDIPMREPTNKNNGPKSQKGSK